MVDFAKKLREMKRSQQEEAEVAKSSPKAESNVVAQKTGVPEVIGSSYKALAVPAQQFTQFLTENIGDQGLRPMDLDKVKVPAGGAISWEIETLEGTQSTQVLEGIILHFKDTRVYWAAKGNGNTPPDCSSMDSKIGIGNPGGDCHKCPFAQFGSAVNQKGEATKGQACKSVRLFLFLRQDDMIPMLVPLPPTSIQNSKKYFLRLVANGYPYYGVTTQLRLAKAQSSGGDVYSMATFAMGRKLEQEEFEKVQLIGKAMRDLFSQATVDAADARVE